MGGGREAGGRYKKLPFHASLDQICIFILANTPHHCPQIIYTDLHVASDSSRTPGCYFGPLAVGLTAFLKSYHLLSCAAQTPRQKQEKHWVDTKVEFIFSLREADISHCTALAPAHLVLSDCAPQKNPLLFMFCFYSYTFMEISYPYSLRELVFPLVNNSAS